MQLDAVRGAPIILRALDTISARCDFSFFIMQLFFTLAKLGRNPQV
jgi:hypothetical protein